MMQKILLILVSSFVLGACTHAETNDTTNVSQPDSPDAYAAVAAAIQSGEAAKCTITKTDDATTNEYYIKSDKVRMTGITTTDTSENQYSAMLMDGEFIYTWDETAKTGVKFPIPDPDSATQNNQQLPQVPDFTDQTARDEYINDGYTVDCQVEDVSENLFTAPTDVTFTDMSGLMQNAQQMMEQTNTKTGENMSAEEQQLLQQQAEQMMQQYGQ